MSLPWVDLRSSRACRLLPVIGHSAPWRKLALQKENTFIKPRRRRAEGKAIAPMHWMLPLQLLRPLCQTAARAWARVSRSYLLVNRLWACRHRFDLVNGSAGRASEPARESSKRTASEPMIRNNLRCWCVGTSVSCKCLFKLHETFRDFRCRFARRCVQRCFQSAQFCLVTPAMDPWTAEFFISGGTFPQGQREREKFIRGIPLIFWHRDAAITAAMPLVCDHVACLEVETWVGPRVFHIWRAHDDSHFFVFKDAPPPTIALHATLDATSDGATCDFSFLTTGRSIAEFTQAVTPTKPLLMGHLRMVAFIAPIQGRGEPW